MGIHSVRSHYEEPNASRVSVELVRAKPGKREEIVKRIRGKGMVRVMNRAVVFALDADSDDLIYVVEYWSDEDEFANGTHAESGARFWPDVEPLIEERTILFEADPIWVQGLREPAGVEKTLEQAGYE